MYVSRNLLIKLSNESSWENHENEKNNLTNPVGNIIEQVYIISDELDEQKGINYSCNV